MNTSLPSRDRRNSPPSRGTLPKGWRLYTMGNDWRLVCDEADDGGNDVFISSYSLDHNAVAERLESYSEHEHAKTWIRTPLEIAAPKLLDLLQEFVDDGECYCADYVATKSSCAHCRAKETLASIPA